MITIIYLQMNQHSTVNNPLRVDVTLNMNQIKKKSSWRQE